ncbi:MAG: leucine-rich repeat domain-containing protein [Alistipes sp.]|nr:leucine-rich repeat domain-containing protein [Alistipes sp.]
MKRYILTLYTLLAATFSVVAQCPDNELWYSTTDNRYANSYNFEQCNLIAHSYENGIYVVQIHLPWQLFSFSHSANLQSVIMPEGMTTIGDSAFSYCSALEEVTLPQSITAIGNSAFAECTSLSQLTLPDNLAEIGAQAFSNCASLSKIVVPSGVTEIKDATFYSCDNLEEVILPEGVTRIGEQAFQDCHNLNKITLPSSITEIHNYAFQRCYGLKEIVLPDSLTTIGNYAFTECNNLRHIAIPQHVTSIGESAFHGCEALTSATIPEGVVEIKNFAFGKCAALESITIPGSVEKIWEYAFWGCTNLKSLTIGCDIELISTEILKGIESLTLLDSATISQSAIAECVNLKSISGKYASEDGMSIILDGKLIAFVGENVDEYSIPEGVTAIGERVFAGCTTLSHITIPGSVTEIGANAFKDCSGLRKLTLGCDITLIDSTVRSNIEEVVLLESITTLGDRAFFGFNKLATATLPSSIVQVSEWAFDGCANLRAMNVGCDLSLVNHDHVKLLESVTILEGVSAIGNGWFEGCTNLREVTIPSSVTAIGDIAFMGCESLESVAMGEGVSTIGSMAFAGCKSLQSITLPDSIADIGSMAFSDCVLLTKFESKYASEDGRSIIIDGKFAACITDGITDYTIPDNVTKIGNGLFKGCPTLHTLTIPGSVTEIGNNAFTECGNLNIINIGCDLALLDKQALANATNITLLEGVSTIPERVFEACANLEEITLPHTISEVSEWAFIGCSNLRTINIGCDLALIDNIAVEGIKNITLLESATISSNTFLGYNSLMSFRGKYATKDGKCLIADGAIVAFLATGITGYTIPEGTTEIRENTFTGSATLQSISIPSSVTKIAANAFDGCDNLAYMTIGCDISLIGINTLKNLQSITLLDDAIVSESSFDECQNLEAFIGKHSSEDGRCLIIDGKLVKFLSYDLTEYSIPEGVTALREGVFAGCSHLEKLSIPGSVTEIGKGAFDGCSSLGELSVGCDITLIDKTIIKQLHSINLQVWVSGITDNTFAECYNLSSFSGKYASEDGRCLVMNDRLVAFASAGLSEYNITAPVTAIGPYAFRHCTALQHIGLPSTLQKIEEGAFSGCSSLSDITIPEGVVEIGNNPFDKCKSLTCIVFESLTPPAITSLGKLNDSTMIYVAKPALRTYRKQEGWKDYKQIIEAIATEK